MAGPLIRLYADENVSPRLAQALASAGVDALSCEAAGRASRRISDQDPLLFAAESGRAILTFDYVDYLLLDAKWKQLGRVHAGIIVSHQVNELRMLQQRVRRHLDVHSRTEQHNALRWLEHLPTP